MSTSLNNNTPTDNWTIDDARNIYGIDNWANDYFAIDDKGLVTAKTLNTAIPLMKIIDGLLERDLQMPVLLRIENILDAQVMRLNEAFASAIEKQGYQNTYRGVYPIKVNQQSHVVEEIADFGARYRHGFEVGSKAEMIAALATLKEPGSLVICNGYKDAEFIELGLQAIKLGFDCFFVIETPAELPIIMERSKSLNIEPRLGVRIKTTSQVSGHWNSTSGDRSVFGLSSIELIELVDELRSNDMLQCLQLLHCHLGSQMPRIQDIRQGVVEACRYYSDLAREGAALSHIDLGGGLAVDYTGARNNDSHSRNYSLEEYCEGVIETLRQTLDEYNIDHPVLVTESGRATVAYSSILLFNILDTTHFEPVDIKSPENPHNLTKNLTAISDYLTSARVQECYNDAHFYRNEIRELFKRGQISLRERSVAENIFLQTLQEINSALKTMDHIPVELEEFDESLADIYYGNFSLFQSLPDIWAINQIFPIMPVHRLNELPSRNAVLADITCDCEGKIDRFIGEDSEIVNTLPVHPLVPDEEYYMGVFLVGAYQETLGDLHNLFGDTNVVSVRINSDHSIDFVKEIHGDTIADVLSYVEYEPRELLLAYRDIAERAVREKRISAKERQQIIATFKESMQGYTYYEKEHQG